MSDLSRINPENLEPEATDNKFWEYLRSLHPETMKQLAKPNSSEVIELVKKSVYEILNNFLTDDDNYITTSHDELSAILGSAMVDGYFLSNAEQRMGLEKVLLKSGD